MNRNQKKLLYESIMKSVAKTVKRKLNEQLGNTEVLSRQYDSDWWGDNEMSFDIDIDSSIFVGVYNDKFFNKYGITCEKEGNTCGSIYNQDNELIGKYIYVCYTKVAIMVLPDDIYFKFYYITFH